MLDLPTKMLFIDSLERHPYGLDAKFLILSSWISREFSKEAEMKESTIVFFFLEKQTTFHWRYGKLQFTKRGETPREIRGKNALVASNFKNKSNGTSYQGKPSKTEQFFKSCL